MLWKSLLALVVAFGVAAPADAQQTLPEPSGRVVLVVGGKITQTNTGSVAHFDMMMLKELEPQIVNTETPRLVACWDA